MPFSGRFLAKNQKKWPKIVGAVFEKSAKTLFGPFWAIFYGFSQNDGKYQKSTLVHFVGLKCALLHAKFQKNCWSGFRDNPRRTHGRRLFLGTFGFQPGTKKVENT